MTTIRTTSSATSAPLQAPSAQRVSLSSIQDDKAMLRAAAEATRDIARHRPEVYWADMVGSALIGYATLAGAILAENTWIAVLSGLVSVLTLYRALLFIHEISHFRGKTLPGFRTAWNLLVGVPMLTPSLMYEGVHTLHHARTRYGTVEDPEYLPLALMKPWSLPVFLLIALLAPPALIIRWGIMTPLGALFPPVRRMAWERFSALAINPAFRRRPPEDEHRLRFLWQEIACSLWAIALIASIFWLGWKPLLIAMAVASAVAVFNQLRTLVAHLWENEGEAMTVTAQYLDSVNVPPPSPLAGLWAPVGLRYHALHHLLPSLPYHSLAEAHRRLHDQLGLESTYARSSHKGMIPLVVRIARGTMGRR